MGLEKNQERVEVMFLAIDPSGSMMEKRTFACEVPSLALAGLKAQSGAWVNSTPAKAGWYEISSMSCCLVQYEP